MNYQEWAESRGNPAAVVPTVAPPAADDPLATTFRTANTESTEDRLRATERNLVEVLEQLQRSYIESAQPYLQRLYAVREALNPRRLEVTVEQARALGLVK